MQKSIFALLWMDDQQKGTDLPEKLKTRLPFSPLAFWNRSTRSGSFVFKMAAMLQIPWVFPLVSCLESTKAVQCPRTEPKIGDKSQQTPRYSPVCPRGQPPGMAADKCITALFAMTYLISSTILRETFSEAIFIFPSQYLPAICKRAELVRQ